MKHLWPKDLLCSVLLPRFTGQVTIRHNATSLWLPGEADITFDNGDQIQVVSDASGNWRVIDIQKNLAPARGKLTANRTYYVRTDGSDSNNGLANTSGGAFLTIQKAIDVALGTLDFGGFTVTIQLADGSYTVSSLAIGSGVGLLSPASLVIRGNNTTPGNVKVSGTGNAFAAESANAICTILDMEVSSSGSGTSCFRSSAGGQIFFGNVRFAATGSGGHITVTEGGAVQAVSNYEIVGGSTYHAQIAGGMFRATGRNITLTGTPAFSGAYIAATRCGSAIVFGCTYTGSATGKSYDAQTNAVVSALGATLPGDVAGTTSTGGQYA
ncbi:hypothetical protein [Afipia felis]|uniref:Uncharacterized protein n=2 Tax=Afipia felis TaxID=1035 RepID=A0A380WA49_AFIFE|nr:hypothetical protein [Afipia felis]EKS28239.1 hypothetical protein HMPREF9697_00767 [Afipia felis ATCC 53690]SUU76949.1 Uncharacterised protein [Afipia felis]SUU85015.1 Uncharacterised protein [Afipia felis]